MTEMKLFIKAKFKEGIRKPNDILNVMRLCKMTEQCKSKFVTRTETSGPPTISTPQLQAWCQVRIQVMLKDNKSLCTAVLHVAESLKTE